MFTGHTPAVLGRRACAVLAACSAALHGLMLGHGGSATMLALMATMMIACLYCARDLWLSGTLGAWCAVALMNLAMIAVHTPMPGHQHGAVLAAPHQTSTLMGAATLLALIEVVIAAGVLVYRTRGRSVINPGAVVGTRDQASNSPTIRRSIPARVLAGSTMSPSSSFWART